MSKKIVGSYKGKPIVEGDANTFTKNEILVNGTPVSIKVREGGKTKDIGGSEGVCYYKFNSPYIKVDTLLTDIATAGAKIGWDFESVIDNVAYSIYILGKTEKGKCSAVLYSYTSDAYMYAAAVVKGPIYAVSTAGGQELIDGAAKAFEAMSNCTPITGAEYKSLFDSL